MKLYLGKEIDKSRLIRYNDEYRLSNPVRQRGRPCPMQETVSAKTTAVESKKSKKFLFWLVPLLVLAGVYFAGVAFFSQHFLPNTEINGQDAGGKSVKSVAAIASDRSRNATLDLTTMEGDVQQIPVTDFSYDCWFDSDLSALRRSQSPFQWPMAFFGQETWDVPLAVSFDEAALSQQLQALPCMTDPSIQAPVDAHIEKTETGFTIKEAIEGNTLDFDRMWSAVTGVLLAGDLSLDLTDPDCYRHPSVEADDPGLQEQMSKWKQYEKLKITIDLIDAEEVLNGDVLKDWLRTDGSTITIDPDALGSYITDLSARYNTYETQRTFNTTGAGAVTVGGSGLDTYGFKMNTAKTTEDVQAALDNLDSCTVAATWQIPALCRNSVNGDIGTTYIEADLSRQHLWYYQNGVLQLESDFVSGMNSQPGRRTPCGVFRVWGKQRDRVLTGPDYESFVSYWMPFTWTGCGLHDAPWRGAFGGTIYLHNGSHGCINLPSRNAAALYNAVEYNTPVIVYRS